SVAISGTKNVTEYHAVALAWVKRGSVGAAELLHILQYRFAAFTRFAEDGVASDRLRPRRTARGGSRAGWPLGTKGESGPSRGPKHARGSQRGRHRAAALSSLPLAPRSTLATLSAQGAKGAQGAMPQTACRST